VKVTLSSSPGGAKYLADNFGRSLYLFQSDKNGRSLCNGACAAAWPPLPGNATADTDLPGPITTITRDDGKPQAAYQGHPLYYSKNDARPGDTKGQGTTNAGGAWYLVSPDGKAITTLPQPMPAMPGGY
jgi:predicted lipoprotein with Yx(FWY)xxD motif